MERGFLLSAGPVPAYECHQQRPGARSLGHRYLLLLVGLLVCGGGFRLLALLVGSEPVLTRLVGLGSLLRHTAAALAFVTHDRLPGVLLSIGVTRSVSWRVVD